jgi:hypothetical protein
MGEQRTNSASNHLKSSMTNNIDPSTAFAPKRVTLIHEGFQGVRLPKSLREQISVF